MSLLSTSFFPPLPLPPPSPKIKGDPLYMFMIGDYPYLYFLVPFFFGPWSKKRRPSFGRSGAGRIYKFIRVLRIPAAQYIFRCKDIYNHNSLKKVPPQSLV